MNSSAIDLRSPRSWAVTIVFILAVCAIGAIIGVNATPDAWYQALHKAPWNPPNWVFGPVWFVLYVLIGIAGARTFLQAPTSAPMIIWGLQMMLNWAWSPIWFRLHAPSAALVVIIAIFALVLAFVVMTWRSDRVAAGLFVPYALWVGFASTLNLAVVVLN